MKIIRDSVFETNSSSTHSIVIPHSVKDSEYCLYDSLYHDYGFGRGESRLVDNYDEKLAYTYLVLKDFRDWYDEDGERKGMVTEEDIKSFEKKVINVFNELVKTETFYDSNPTPQDIFDIINEVKTERTERILENKSSLWYCAEVDHTEDFATNGFVEKILNADEDYIKKFIFNRDSYITVGGDEYRGFNIKRIGFEYDYDYSLGEDFFDKVEECRKDNDIFLKGN